MSVPSPIKTVLVLTANPKSTSRLRLDEEVRDIKTGLQRSRNRDQFNLVQEWAVRPRDIQRAMLDIKPNIVHFSGHGAGDDGLVFEDETGSPKLVEGQALARLFDLFSDTVECVVLNGCYSLTQAQAIAQYIENVIGMTQEIGDRAAIEFSVGFYTALGAGESIAFAYELGCNAIHLEGIPEYLTPVLYSKETTNSEDKHYKVSSFGSTKQISLVQDSEPQNSKLEAEISLLSDRNIDYTRLKNLLSTRNWEEADKETASVILRLTGRLQKGWLDDRDIRKFPCQDLHIIDHLWVTYSSGQFGFSVQKRMYEGLGGTSDYNIQIWERWGQLVGWRFENKWVEYDASSTSFSKPLEGHFPWRTYSLVWGGWWLFYSCIISRLAECNIEST